MAFRIRALLFALLSFTAIWLVASAISGTGSADAARYAVAQCGWHVSQDAAWYDLSADRFSKSNYCQTPDSADPFDGVHMLSQTRSTTKTVGGTRFATWRWQAPPGTGIVNVHGQRWQYLRDGFQHRLGGVSGGAFSPFLALSDTDSVKRDFNAGFWPFAEAFESRLVCYKTEDKLCNAEGTVLAGVRGLTITIDDSVVPTTQVSGGLTAQSWLRGDQSLEYGDTDAGSGVRFAETYIDGAIRARSETNCGKVLINGQWRGTKMQPCPTGVLASHGIDTRTLSDGPHMLQHCALDFAVNIACIAARAIYVDNNPPSAPKALKVTGGEEWRKSNGFELTWTEPDQSPASPIVASVHRMFGPEGFQGGPWIHPDKERVSDVRVPGSGEFRVELWLVDQAGNVDENRKAEVTLRLDEVPPAGYFLDPPAEDPGLIRVPVSDRYSGVSTVNVAWRVENGDSWQEIPGVLSGGAEQMLVARLPEDLPKGMIVLRAAIADRAGNVTVTDRRANGSQMTVNTAWKDQTTLAAGLSKGPEAGTGSVQVGYGEGARLSGRLSGVNSGGIASAELTVTEFPYLGSRADVSHRTVTTDPRGYFELWLAAGPGRRVKVDYPGARLLDQASSSTLEMGVTGRLSFKVKPRRLRTGGRVRFRGRVSALGAWQPSRGNVVQIQYFEKSARRWRPVVLARTDRHGRFRSSYRFRYITGVAKIRLRALLIPSSRFPYSGAASNPVLIRVRE